MNIDISSLRKNVGPDPAPDNTTPAPFWDVAAAAWHKQTVTGANVDYEGQLRQNLMFEMLNKLSPASRAAVARQTEGRNFADPLAAQISFVTDAASREVPTDPTKWGSYPLDTMQFQNRIDRQRQQEVADAQAVLDRPGGGFAEFLGSAGRSVVDPINIFLAPLGAEGSLLRVIASEAALNGLAEGMQVPSEKKIADELGLPKPDMMSRVAMGALTGGALAGILGGAVRYAGHLISKRELAHTGAPAGIHPLDHEAEIQATQNQMTGDVPVSQAMADNARTPTPGRMPAMSDFDFSATGNASPRTNRVGYVYGKLLEMGYEPHIAAGLVGNGMVESGPAMHPGAIGDNGNAFGVWQWNGPRRDAYLEFAHKKGAAPEDIDTQIEFLDHELKGPEAAAWERIKTAKTPEEAAAAVSQFFERPGIPRLGRRVGFARDIYRQFSDGSIPRWTGAVADAGDEVPRFSTSRGYTGEGQIGTASGTRIDVKYEVVDASLLRRARGDLQPRDRSRTNSDAWIAETAAKLDPAQLMPSPNAATGTPIIGPDNVIESGNGRVGAITHAYEHFPDRGAAYRKSIEDLTGQPIPAGMEQPVLVARRTSDLTHDARKKLVVDAQDSGVARMTPTEIAQVSSRTMTPEVMATLNPEADMFHTSNAGFVRRALEGLPASERNALFNGDGGLNSAGRARLSEAMFARAWNAPDILTRFTETDGGELKSLMEALDKAAPSWAALKADIEAGRVRPEADISAFVLDAMRLIAAARDVTARDGLPMAQAVAELLDEIDMLDGAVSPLTVALIKNKFWKNGRAASASEIGDFLKRYAVEARKVASTETMFGASPAEVLRKIDPEVFGDLPNDLGKPRPVVTRGMPETAPPMAETAYAKGAESPEAVAADGAAMDDLRAGGVKPDPNNPKLVDTRGSGERFHGSRSGELPNVLDEYTYSAGNIYGQGFYTTDAVAIASGYGKKGGGIVYHVEEIAPIHAFDMEQPIPDFILKSAKDTRGDLAGLVDDALLENPKSVREFYDELRGWSASHQISADTVQELFDGFAEVFRDNGFNALDHTGGLNTKRAPHQVRIYLNPRDDIQISKADLTPYAAAISHSPLPTAAQATSSASTLDQGAPGSSLATAENPGAGSLSNIAGRPSQGLSLNDVARVKLARAEFANMTFRMTADGPEMTVADLLDDIEADETLVNVLNLCNLGGQA